MTDRVAQSLNRRVGRFSSLRVRLLLSSLATTVAMVVISLGVNLILLRHVAREQTEEALNSIAVLLAHAVAPGLDFDSKESVRNGLAGVFEIDEVVFAAVTRPDGEVYQALGDFAERNYPPVSETETVISDENGMMVAHVPIRSTTAETIGQLHLGYSLESVRAELDRGLVFLLLAGVLLTLAATLVTSGLGRRLIQPILELAHAARSMAEGRFGQPLVVRNRDEVGVVAEAFNEMAARLTDSRAEVERQNRELEQKVRERTKELREKNLALAVQNERVTEMSRLKSAFLANMSHELRTPLNAILALSELLGDEVTGPLATDEQRKQVGMIHQSGQNLLRLINDVLDLSKIEAGRMEIRYERTEPARVLHEAAEELRALANAKGLLYQLRVHGEGSAWIDVDRVRQILMNLIGNAIKFTERGRIEVDIRLDADEDMLHLSVRDSGVGIAAEDQQTIFDEFRQVDGSTTRRFGGTGLGLAICRRLTQLMGGEVRVMSELGMGSLFTVQLPAPSTEPAAVPLAGLPDGAEPPPLVARDPLARPDPIQRRHPARVAASGQPRGCVLVVEDDERVIEALVRYLTREGFDVRVAVDGMEALQEFERDRPDVMLLDLMLPGLNGFQVLEKLTQGGGKPLVPVVVHTAKDLTDGERRALDSCVEKVFTKGGGGVRLLLEEIERLVEEHRSGQNGSEVSDSDTDQNERAA
ncbi:MAG: response regulator [Candidatus Eisenbacteria bacterium]|nr:response regulator [Candidatus Eisenbacteria bacterium]